MPAANPIIRDGLRHLNVKDVPAYAIQAADNEPERPTYRAFVFGLAPTGVVNDLVALGGATGKLIRLKSLIVSGVATAASNIPIYLFKRTAGYTGGTATAITKTAADTTDPVSAVTLNHYASGAPTAGAGAMMDGARLNIAPAANGSIDRFMFQYTWQNDKAPNLRSATEFLALGLNGFTMPAGGNLDVSLAWTEEDI